MPCRQKQTIMGREFWRAQSYVHVSGTGEGLLKGFPGLGKTRVPLSLPRPLPELAKVWPHCLFLFLTPVQLPPASWPLCWLMLFLPRRFFFGFFSAASSSLSSRLKVALPGRLPPPPSTSAVSPHRSSLPGPGATGPLRVCTRAHVWTCAHTRVHALSLL